MSSSPESNIYPTDTVKISLPDNPVKPENPIKPDDRPLSVIAQTEMCDLSDISLYDDVVEEKVTVDVEEGEVVEIKQMSKDQDRDQIIQVYFLFIIELFKVTMASFLSMSVIQNCAGEVCSYSENINRHSLYGSFVVGVNGLNIISFAVLYFFEFNREMFLINFLDIDKRLGDYHLPNALVNYQPIKTRLIKYNRIYYHCTLVLLVLTCINWITSGILVFGSFHSLKTLTSYLTNILLVISKLADSYKISKESYKYNYGLSAYIKEYTSFNVIDKDHINISEDNI